MFLKVLLFSVGFQFRIFCAFLIISDLFDCADVSMPGREAAKTEQLLFSTASSAEVCKHATKMRDARVCSSRLTVSSHELQCSYEFAQICGNRQAETEASEALAPEQCGHAEPNLDVTALLLVLALAFIDAHDRAGRCSSKSPQDLGRDSGTLSSLSAIRQCLHWGHVVAQWSDDGVLVMELCPALGCGEYTTTMRRMLQLCSDAGVQSYIHLWFLA